MPILDLENLLQPVSPESPCGDNLEYEAEFIAVDSASRGKPEQEYGDTKIPAEPPEWAEVIRIGTSVLGRTKDLRLGCFVTRGLLALRGLPAFAEGLELLWGYVDQHWDRVHPELDPDDDNDPTLRVNTLSSLNDFSTTVMCVRQCPLVESGMLGTFSLIDVEIAKGTIPAPEDLAEPPTLAAIDGAFEQTGADPLTVNIAAVESCLQSLAAIESRVTDLVGAGQSVNFSSLNEQLNKIKAVLVNQAERFGLGGGEEATDDEAASDDGAEPDAEGASPDAKPASPPSAPPGEIQSREDVLKTLDRLCRYYEKYEPSSPLPLLLRRAQRLATMNFLDIVQELTPEGLMQAKAVGGVREDQS